MFEVERLTKVYGDGTRALVDLSLRFGHGMLGLLGPNGAGKTTFLSLLVLAREPSGGRRLYDGLDASRPSARPAIRRLLGYLPQEFSPIPFLTGHEYLVHCARLREVELGSRSLHRRAGELLEAVGLEHAAERRSGEYSGGMRRRLGIAQALIHEPRLLVVDEPTSGLDPEERIRFRSLIAEVAEERAVVLSTHIVEDVEATCPRLCVIARGRLLFDGTPAELMRPSAGRLWKLPTDRPPAPGLGVVSRRSHPGGGTTTVVLGEEAVEGALPHEPTLEEAYGVFLLDRSLPLAEGEER